MADHVLQILSIERMIGAQLHPAERLMMQFSGLVLQVTAVLTVIVGALAGIAQMVSDAYPTTGGIILVSTLVSGALLFGMGDAFGRWRTSPLMYDAVPMRMNVPLKPAHTGLRRLIVLRPRIQRRQRPLFPDVPQRVRPPKPDVKLPS